VTCPLPLPEFPIEAVEPRSARVPRDSRMLFSVAALLMFGPLAFGAVDTWSIFVLRAASAVLFVIWAFGQLRSSRVSLRWSPVFSPMITFASLMCLQFVPGISAYRHATYSQLLLYISYGAVCFLLVQTFNRSREVRFVATALTIYGTSIALFAVLQNLNAPGKIYWLKTPHFGGWIYGPYVNHNHYAGLMEMLVPVPLVFAFSRFGHTRERWIAASAAAFMAATVFLSGSRGGMIAFAVQMTIFIVFVFRERKKRTVVVLLSGFVLLSIGIITWTGGREVRTRIATLAAEKHSDMSSDIRLQIDRDILRMWQRRPVLGWGQGTFADVYPRFRSFYTDSLVNAAHNDYLQVLAETGILGFGTMIWFLVSVLRPALRKSHKWASDLNGAVAVAAILGISGILVHSLVDFNMQIPANAALFFSLCTVAAMEPRFKTHRRLHRQQHAEYFADTAAPVHS